MLKFDRPSFRSGTMIVKAVVANTDYGFTLRPIDKGTEKEYAVEGVSTEAIEESLLAKYPSFFTAVEPE